MKHNVNQQIRLKNRPTGLPKAPDFTLVETELPGIDVNQILVRNRYLSLDPYMRSQIAGRHITGAIGEGDLMLGETVGEVIESRNSDYKQGDMLVLNGGWQQYFISDGTGARALDARIDPASLALGILGMPGLTAFAGLGILGQPKVGDTLVVSAASGAVGSMVGQYGRTLGCRVIGIAGSDEKCRWLVDTAKFDACINYKTETVADGIDRLCPDGVDIYFDNVGGETLDAVMWRLAIGARVVLCGLMSQLSSETRPAGPNPATIIKARATVRGLVVFDHWQRMAEMVETFMPLVKSDEIQFLEDVSDGLKAAPAAFERLMCGQNFGKTIIKLD